MFGGQTFAEFLQEKFGSDLVVGNGGLISHRNAEISVGQEGMHFIGTENVTVAGILAAAKEFYAGCEAIHREGNDYAMTRNGRDVFLVCIDISENQIYITVNPVR